MFFGQYGFEIVFVVEIVGRGVVGRCDGACVLYMPVFYISDAHISRQRVVAVGACGGNGEDHSPIACEYFATVAIGLLREGLVPLYADCFVATQQCYVSYGGAIGCGK